ncbi:hypothetical protein TIFTF001_011413 [Ficus carica]|uniref:Uncharacterized protein n=1 Tax=Ficus carica TaxID=3494 RepID=A0AA88AAF3_FICCA|nr:hypothetical protein TIFTF001_011413 [Ficus carica]
MFMIWAILSWIFRIVSRCGDNDLRKVSSDNGQGKIKLHHHEYDTRIWGRGTAEAGGPIKLFRSRKGKWRLVRAGEGGGGGSCRGRRWGLDRTGEGRGRLVHASEVWGNDGLAAEVDDGGLHGGRSTARNHDFANTSWERENGVAMATSRLGRFDVACSA